MNIVLTNIKLNNTNTKPPICLYCKRNIYYSGKVFCGKRDCKMSFTKLPRQRVLSPSELGYRIDNNFPFTGNKLIPKIISPDLHRKDHFFSKNDDLSKVNFFSITERILDTYNFIIRPKGIIKNKITIMSNPKHKPVNGCSTNFQQIDISDIIDNKENTPIILNSSRLPTNTPTRLPTNRPDIIKYKQQTIEHESKSDEWDEIQIQISAYVGDLENVKYLYKKGVKIDKSVYDIVMKSDNMELINWVKKIYGKEGNNDLDLNYKKTFVNYYQEQLIQEHIKLFCQNDFTSQIRHIENIRYFQNIIYLQQNYFNYLDCFDYFDQLTQYNQIILYNQLLQIDQFIKQNNTNELSELSQSIYNQPVDYQYFQ